MLFSLQKRKHSTYTHFRGTGSWGKKKKKNGMYLQWCQLESLASSNRSEEKGHK